MSFLRRPVISARGLATGAALGALMPFLLMALGADDILGFHRFDWAMAATVSAGLVFAMLDAMHVYLAMNLALVAVYTVVAFTPVIAKPATDWVRNDAPSKDRLDAVVVLSGFVKADSALSPEALERLLTGLQLLKASDAPRLITTRVVAQIADRRITSDFGQQEVIKLVGVEARWTEVDSVGTTRDEATRAAALLLPSGASNVAVVTSPMHTRRACATFEHVGFRVRCVAAREIKSMTWHPESSSDRLAAFHDYLYERLGMVKYRYKGWIH